MNQKNINKEVKCPQCGHLTLYSLDNPFRPFCNERCRLIDLGDWASEKYKISPTNNDQDFDHEEVEDRSETSSPKHS